MKVRRVDYYPDEYIVGVSRMTFEQHGVYWMVCSLIMSNGGPIPNDPKWIGNLGGMGAARCRRIISDLVALGKLTEKSGKIGQKRAEKELISAQKRIETAQENGRNGGRPPKKNNDLEEPGGFSDEKLTTNHQPSTSNQHLKKESSNEDSKESRASGAPDDGSAVAVLSPADGRPLARKERYPTKAKLPRDGRSIRWPPEFEAAWQAYPVRTEDTREACYAHWRRHVVDNRVDPARIVEAAEAWGMLLNGYEFRIGFLRFCREALWNQPPPKRREEPKSNGQLVAESIARERRGEMWDPFGEIENEQREREHRALHAVCRDDEAGGFEGSACVGGGAYGPDGADGANVVRLLAAGGVRRL